MQWLRPVVGSFKFYFTQSAQRNPQPYVHVHYARFMFTINTVFLMHTYSRYYATTTMHYYCIRTLSALVVVVDYTMLTVLGGVLSQYTCSRTQIDVVMPAYRFYITHFILFFV